jgi:transposase
VAAQANLAHAKRAAQAGTIQLYFLDESGFATVPNVPRAWSPLGRPHHAEAGVSRHRVNVLGALEYGTGRLVYELSRTSIRREAVTAFIDGLAARAEAPLTIVVLDNATIHRNFDAKTLDRWLMEHRLVLLYLPPYSPELNPIEMLWREAKYRWRRFATWTLDQLETEVQALLNGFGSKYKIRFA